jgi:translation initiation factor 5A
MAASADDYDFSAQGSGSSDNIPMEAGQIKKGGLIMIKGRPCKVAEVTTSKTGKHGHAKCNFTTYDIFTNKKLEDMIPSTHGTTVPIVKREEYQLTYIDEDDHITLMDEEGTERSDLKLPKYPDTAAAELRKFFEDCETKDEIVSVTLQVFGNRTEEMVIAWKVDRS